ncbi:MAG: hypothetical protein V4772_08815 [Pseudomonadota bacterium]
MTTKTTPQEAAKLAAKHGADGMISDVVITTTQLAALIDEVRGEAVRVPPSERHAKARQLLADAYEENSGDGPYPTYANLARIGHGDFTLRSIRAIERAMSDYVSPK